VPEQGVLRVLRMCAVLLSLMLVAVTADTAAQGPLQGELRAQLQRRLEAVASDLDGVVGFVIRDLTSGEQIAARLERQPFPTASTIKLSILYELLKQADEGRIDLKAPRELTRAQVVGGSGVVQHLDLPRLSLRDHAALMVIVSDNTSTNVVIDAVDPRKVNARMSALGLSDILLRRKMMDAEAVKRGDENVASPASLARVAELLWSGEGLSPASRELALAMLLEVPGRIRSAIPPRVRVASKTGTLDGVRAEAAVVDVPKRPFSMAVMTTYLTDGGAGERAIADIARAAFSYFERVATGGEHGRRVPY
jgi:beta-lactamase class A